MICNMKVLVIVESLTGNTISFLDHLKEIHGDIFEIMSPKDPFAAFQIEKYDKIMIGCYTWSDGKIPKKTKKFVIENRDILLSKDVLIFGSGWTVYEHFCRAVDNVNIILDNKFPKIKFELRFDPKIEFETLNEFKNYLKGEMKMEYNYAGKQFDTKFLVVGKKSGCKYCTHLNIFMENAMENKFADVTTKVTLEENEDIYDAVVAETGAMELPIIVNLETGEHITGFNPPEVMEFFE